MSLHPRPIVIIGMQRSGTSALAGALVHLGLNLGNEKWLYEGDANNPQGYFENRKIVTLNLRCLEAFQMHPTSFGQLPTNWKEHPMAEDFRADLKKILVEEYEGGRRWGMKQPVTSLLLPLYNDVFSDLGLTPTYVLCVRNPLESMASEARLDFGDSYRVMASLGKMAIGSWLRYTLGSFADTHGHGQLRIVPYEDMLADSRSVLSEIVASEPDWVPAQEQWEAAAASVQSKLRNNEVPEEELERLPALVRDSYRAAIGFDGGDDSRQQVLGLHREFEKWVAAMAEPGLPVGKLGLSWTEGGGRKIAETRFAPAGGWQTVRLEIDAPPLTPLFGLIYGHPCRVWIRRSVWISGNQVLPAQMRCGPGSELAPRNGVLCLHGVLEPDQIRFRTPDGAGPFILELEFWLETGMTISGDAAYRVSRRLDECVSFVEQNRR